MVASPPSPTSRRPRDARPGHGPADPARPGTRPPRDLLELRARRLLETNLGFVADPSFDDPAAVAEILGPPPEPVVGRDEPPSRAPAGLPAYLTSLHEVSLLSREHERYLFRKMNYLKYRAHQLRQALDPRDCEAAQVDAIERLLAEALAVKDRLIRANLRLVVALAKRRVAPGRDFFELVSDGNISLIRAVEKFDSAHGIKFSTYAYWAITNNFNRQFSAEKQRRGRFVTGHEELFEAATDTRGADLEQESDQRHKQVLVRRMLGRLDDRERRVLSSRYGLGGAEAQTLEQVGRALGVTKERARQIETRAREKLRRIALEEELGVTLG